MIEYGHKLAKEAAFQAAQEAAAKGNSFAAAQALEQTKAVNLIGRVSEVILAEFNIPDVPFRTLPSDEEITRLRESLEDKSFAEAFKYLMRADGTTQRELAEKIGTGQPGISRMINNPGGLSMNTFVRIFNGLGWEADDWRSQLLITKALTDVGQAPQE